MFDNLERQLKMNGLTTKVVKFSQPAVYQISVIGNLDKSWSSRLANMQISLTQNHGDKNEYLLIGKLKDQAELNGILNTLYDLHLVIVSIETL